VQAADLKTVARPMAVCSWCHRDFHKGKAIQCSRCGECFCPQRERACLAVHYGAVHP
jgi:uncharacterized OB-fold protein